VKDKHTVGGKMARNSPKIAILLLLFVLNQTILFYSNYFSIQTGNSTTGKKIITYMA
jgi:hypothetical protein